MPTETTTFLDTLRPEVKALPLYNAGLSIEYVRAHYGVTHIAKLGSNENPYGPSPRVLEALINAAPDVALYPEAFCETLRAVLAQQLNIPETRFLFGNGSEDIIAIATHTFLTPGAHVLTFAPSFGLHIIWPQSVGADVEVIRARPDYSIDIDEVIAALRPDTRMLIFGNPSNPVGTTISAADLRRILAALSPQTLLVFDEAYLEYAAADPSYPDFLAILSEAETPWLLLRTFSKAYGLAGLRVGYAIASSPELISVMDRIRNPFNVNRLAQTAAIAALSDMPYVQSVVTRTIAERERLRAELEALNYRIAPSLANFLFLQVREDAGELALKLLTQGVIVKPWREPGYTDHIRVSIGLPSANDQFLTAFKVLAR